MNNSLKHTVRSLVLSLAAGLCMAPAMAEKPAHAGGGKHDKWEKSDKGGKKDRDDQPRYTQGSGDRSSTNVAVQINIGGYFQDSQRVAVREYYEPRFRAGNCPPGLAKKNNGCMPPGQAKKWRKGYRLPSDVVFLPRAQRHLDPPGCATIGSQIRACGGRHPADRRGHQHGDRCHRRPEPPLTSMPWPA